MVKKMVDEKAKELLETICKHHDFNLKKPISIGESKRLLNFVELFEEPDKYEETKNMNQKLFYTARCELRIQIQKSINLAKH